jgi:hypothetical protein
MQLGEYEFPRRQLLGDSVNKEQVALGCTVWVPALSGTFTFPSLRGRSLERLIVHWVHRKPFAFV